MKGKEISSLYRSYSPQMNTYTPDGQGRDMYINYNNGGFWSQGVKIYRGEKKQAEVSARYHYKSLPKHVAPFKYQSDGSGRDGYVIFESGGLQRDHKALNQYHLKDFLRTPESCIFNFHKNTTRSGTTAKTHYVSKAEWEANQELKKLEKGLIKRLYLNEKHKFAPAQDKKPKVSQTCSNFNKLPKSLSKSYNIVSRNKTGDEDKDQLPSIDQNDPQFLKNTIYKINNYQFNKKEFNKMLNQHLHIRPSVAN